MNYEYYMFDPYHAASVATLGEALRAAYEYCERTKDSVAVVGVTKQGIGEHLVRITPLDALLLEG